MNADLKQDIETLSDAVKRFTLERIAPHVAAWDEAGEFPRELYREAAALGLLGLGYPEALGGTPAPFALRNAVSTTMAHHSASGGLMASLFSLNIGLPPVLRHGAPDVQQEVIPAVLRGEKIAALAITEPGAGSMWRACAPRPGAKAMNGSSMAKRSLSPRACVPTGSRWRSARANLEKQSPHASLPPEGALPPRGGPAAARAPAAFQ